MAVPVRAVGPPRLRDRLGRMLFGDLFRRGAAAAGRAGRGAGAGPRRISAAGRLRQPVEALECAGTALGLRRRRRRADRRRSCSTAPITARRCRPRWPPRASRRGATRPTCAPTAPQYAAKFAALQPRLAAALPCAMPDAAFYLWAQDADRRCANSRGACSPRQAVTVLPGSYLARDAHGTNPGRGLRPDRTGRERRRVQPRRRPDRRRSRGRL